jgi:HlyD family secretion protein
MAGVWSGLGKMAGRPWTIAAAFAAAAFAVWFFAFRGGEEADPYRTASVDRGVITRTVSATGKLEPLVSVDVGSTVSGLVEEVLVDFNDVVRAGQVLARVQPDTFRQRVEQQQASVAQAQANLRVAEAELQRYQRLADEGFASDQLIVQRQADRDVAAAALRAARAQLASAQVDLGNSVITSPINGVVVDRQIDPGQSVAASFQAPVLFIIAQDLSRLQANITVDEADIGDVREGQSVRFTVDAFPDDEFEGVVSQVRQQGVDTNGVVSYTVVVQADNPGRRLLPGMTANAEIIIEQSAEVARLPNAALRFRPSDPALIARAQELTADPQRGRRRSDGGEAVAQDRGGGAQGGAMMERLAAELTLTPAQQAQARDAFRSAMAAAGPPPGPDAAQGERRAFMRRVRQAAMAQLEPLLTAEQKARLQTMRGGEGRPRAVRRAVVWVLQNGEPTPIPVELGVADDSYTEIVSGLAPDAAVITGGGPSAPTADRQRGPAGGLAPAPGAMRIRGA